MSNPDKKASRPHKELEKGHIIANRYEVEKLLGFGGMGSVYLVDDKILGKEKIAIKLLREEFSNDTVHTQRFLREVQLMRRVNHKNVVRTFDVGVDGSTVYFTMEYVPGISLLKLISKQNLSSEEIAHITIQIVEGLSAIHSKNIIHRDLKPGNIIMMPDTSIKITDFGVARPEYSDLTAHNEVIGSSAYMSPESWNGAPPAPPVDYYSLGVMLYEIVTGSHPFKADSPATLMRLHLDTPAKPPIKINKTIPSWLNRLILRLLEKSEKNRLSDPDELISYIKENLNPKLHTDSDVDLKNSNIPLVSQDLLNRLEKMSQKAVGQNAEEFSPNSSTSSINSQAISLMFYELVDKISSHLRAKEEIKAFFYQVLKSILIVLTLCGITFILDRTINENNQTPFSFLNFFAPNKIENLNARTSLTNIISLYAPDLITMLLLSLVPASFLFSFQKDLKIFFKSVYSILLFYTSALVLFMLMCAYSELQHFKLSPITFILTTKSAILQLSYIVLLSPINVTFLSSLTNSGISLSSPILTPICNNLLLSLITIFHIVLLLKLSLKNFFNLFIKKPFIWILSLSFLITLLLFVESVFFDSKDSLPFILNTSLSYKAIFFGLVNWGILISLMLFVNLYFKIKNKILFGNVNRKYI